MAEDKEKKSLDEILADLNNILSRMPDLAESIKTPEIKPIDFSGLVEKKLNNVDKADVEPVLDESREAQPLEDNTEKHEVFENSETINLEKSDSCNDNSFVNNKDEVKVLENTNDFGVPDIDFLLNMANESSEKSNTSHQTESEDEKPLGGEMEEKRDESVNRFETDENSEKKENEAKNFLEEELNKLSIEADALVGDGDSIKENSEIISDIGVDQKQDKVDVESQLNEDSANSAQNIIEKSSVDTNEETVKLDISEIVLEPSTESNQENKKESIPQLNDNSLNLDSVDAESNQASLDTQEETMNTDSSEIVLESAMENNQAENKSENIPQLNDNSTNSIENTGVEISLGNKSESDSIVENELNKLDLDIESKEEVAAEKTLESELGEITLDTKGSSLGDLSDDSSKEEKTLIFDPNIKDEGEQLTEEKTVVFSPSQTSQFPEENQDFTVIEPPDRVPNERIKNVGFVSLDKNLLNHALKIMDEICLASETKPMFIKRAFVLDYTEEMNANFINQKASESSCVAVVAVGEFPHEKIYELETVFSSGGKIFTNFTSANFSKSKAIDFIMDLIAK